MNDENNSFLFKKIASAFTVMLLLTACNSSQNSIVYINEESIDVFSADNYYRTEDDGKGLFYYYCGAIYNEETDIMMSKKDYNLSEWMDLAILSSPIKIENINSSLSVLTDCLSLVDFSKTPYGTPFEELSDYVVSYQLTKINDKNVWLLFAGNQVDTRLTFDYSFGFVSDDNNVFYMGIGNIYYYFNLDVYSRSSEFNDY